MKRRKTFAAERRRKTLPPAAQDAIALHANAHQVILDLAGRGIFTQLDERGRAFWVETKGIAITDELARRFEDERFGITRICAAAGLRREAGA